MNETTNEQEVLLLRRKLDLLLRTGKLLMESAADTNRIERNMKRVAAYLGIPEEKLHIDIRWTMLMVNVSDEKHSFSKFQKCEKHGINMEAISKISKLSWRAIEQDYSLDKYEEELEKIARHVNVIAAAYSLVGKVGYFWGGKSTVIGMDPSWGAVQQVSAEGSQSTGTLRAYGLDCSGFVTWAVINGYKDQGMQAAVGDGTSDQWEKAGVVSEADAQPGDLVFQRGPEAGSNNHVGILCGKTDSGDWIAVHCSSSKNGVTVGEAYSASFRYIRKPSFYQDTTAEENETTATENDVLTEESAEKLLTDVVRSDALKDALASGDTVSSDLLADFKNKALQEDEEEDEVETLTLDQETMDDAVDTFDDDVETLEMEN